MKTTIVISLLSLLLISSSNDLKSDTAALIKKNWYIFKTVEVLSGDTTIYGGKRSEKHIHYLDYDNSLGGRFFFTSDSTGYCDAWKKETFTWETMDEDRIKISIDSLQDDSKNRHFFGVMDILELTDSSAVFEKNISRNGRWKRTFYLIIDKL